MNRRVTRNRFCKNYLTSKNDFWKNHYFYCTMAHFVWTIGWFIGDFSHSITGLNFKESSTDENSSSPIGPIFGSHAQPPIQNVFLRQKESLDVRKPREFPNFIRRYCILPCRLRITRNLLKLRRIHSSGFRFPTHQLSWRKSTFPGKKHTPATTPVQFIAGWCINAHIKPESGGSSSAIFSATRILEANTGMDPWFGE